MDRQASLLYSALMRALLIHNPAAGPRDTKNDLDKVVSFLASRGWRVELQRTGAQGDATRMAREAAARGYDVAVAVGGDGTLREVATGLVGSETMLGVLPVGTGNVWARNLGIPLWTPASRSALLEAARIMAQGRVQRIDLGQVAGEHFIIHTGLGLDAQIAHEVEPRRTKAPRRLRNLSYLVMLTSLAASMRGSRVTIKVDGRTIRQRAFLVLAFNAQFYGGSICVAPLARIDDGYLDVYVFKGSNGLDVLGHVARFFAGLHMRDPRAEYYRASHLEVLSEEPIPVQADGDPICETPVSISIVPRALRVIVPREIRAPLFQNPPEDTLS